MMGPRQEAQTALFYDFSIEDHVPIDHVEGPKHKPPKYISETDPQAAWSLKDGPGRFSYEVNYLADDLHAIIVDVEATPARLSQEIIAAKTMLERSAKSAGFAPNSLAADKSYGTGPFLSWLFDHAVKPYIPVLDRKAQTFGKFTRDDFTYDPTRDLYVCPQGHDLSLKSINEETRVKRYKPKLSSCRDCPIKGQCTDAPTRSIVRLMDEKARQKARDLGGHPSLSNSPQTPQNDRDAVCPPQAMAKVNPPPTSGIIRSHRRISPRRHRPKPQTPRKAGSHMMKI